VSTERPIEERERLLELTAEYLLEHGVIDLRLRPLGDAIGCSHRVLLYYFSSREQLVSEALDEATRQASVRDATVLGPSGNGPVYEELIRVWRRLSGPELLPVIRLFTQVAAMALHDERRHAGFLETLKGGWSAAYLDFLRARNLPDDEAIELSTEIVGMQRGLLFELATGGSLELLDRTFAAAAERWSEQIDGVAPQQARR
jgi:AcrR family transcriptional regulator